MDSDADKRPLYKLDFLKSAKAEFARIPEPLLPDLATAIEALRSDPAPPGHLSLKGYPPEIRRIVVGKYRVVYEVKEHLVLVLVLKVGNRATVYEDLARLMGRVPPARRGGR